MSTPVGVAVLGATGSVGGNTLAVLRQLGGRFVVSALGAGSDAEAMAVLCGEYAPLRVAMADPAAARRLRQLLTAQGLNIEVVDGEQGMCALAEAPEVSVVVAGIVGAAGLPPVLAAARAGKKLLLANKEALVCAGELLLNAVKRGGGELLPVDSEHNAIFQCLGGIHVPEGVRRIVLTASGGPFLNLPVEDFAAVTPEQACAHPVWNMGPKISVDSATMMNKGLELIEACHLFALPPSRVAVVVHPQGAVHGLVEYRDGSLQAQLSVADMRLPIAVALTWPQREATGVDALDLTALGRLDFIEPDPRRFPCLGLAQQAAEMGGGGPAALNAANELAVAAFLQHRIKFNDIVAVVEAGLATADSQAPDSLAALAEIDRRSRAAASQAVKGS